MSGYSHAPAPPQQRKAAVEQRGGPGNAVSIDPTGGELDRQRDAIELRADFGNQRRFVVAELELAEVCRDAFDEQLCSGISKDVGCAQSRALGRAIQWEEAMHAFASGLEGFTRGCQHLKRRRFPYDAC